MRHQQHLQSEDAQSVSAKTAVAARTTITAWQILDGIAIEELQGPPLSVRNEFMKKTYMNQASSESAAFTLKRTSLSRFLFNSAFSF
jgi:hypothetical protein